MAEPSSLGGKSLLKEWPRGVSETTAIRERRNFLSTRSAGNQSIHSVMFYTIYANMISLVEKEVTYGGE